METKKIYGEDFEIFEEGKIEGDFIHPNKNIYIDGDLEVGGNLEVGKLKITGSIKVQSSYIVIKWEEIGGSQKIGWSQEVGGNATIQQGMNTGLYITVKGTLKCNQRLFAGICNWRDITNEEKTITCERLECGKVIYGILKETGITLNEEEVEIIVEGNKKTISRKFAEALNLI